MFTGIVEATGEVAAVEERHGGARLVVSAPATAADSRIGASVAVNGTCLTVVGAEEGCLHFDVVRETLARTNLGDLKRGDRVNLERPMRADGRFDGHIVQGHVDGTAVVTALEPEGAGRRLCVALDPCLRRYVVEKGSVTLDGISLTVARVTAEGFEVAIVPHTWAVTNLAFRRAGERLNVEVDILAKYVERLLRQGAPAAPGRV